MGSSKLTLVDIWDTLAVRDVRRENFIAGVNIYYDVFYFEWKSGFL